MNNKAMVIFDHTYPKIIDLFISFPEFVEAYKKSKTHLFHMLIFVIQSILASHAQTGHIHFWLCPPQTFLVSFYFLRIWNNMQNLIWFHLFFLQVKSILDSHHHTCHTHFWLSPPQKFWIIFPSVWYCTNMQKTANFLCSFFRYGEL